VANALLVQPETPTGLGARHARLLGKQEREARPHDRRVRSIPLLGDRTDSFDVIGGEQRLIDGVGSGHGNLLLQVHA
jgi:hypothetical protein